MPEQIDIAETVQYRGPQFPESIPPQIRSMAEGSEPPIYVYFFRAVDGRCAWCPISEEMTTDAVDAESLILRMAESAIRGMPLHPPMDPALRAAIGGSADYAGPA